MFSYGLPRRQPDGGLQERSLSANSAARVVGGPGHGDVKIEPLAIGSRKFVQSMKGSAALLQDLVENDPHLIHYYPFEGATSTDRLRRPAGKPRIARSHDAGR